ncbi:alpha/beta hydrolase [Mesorhizobium sp. M3A.F.Ca.ET.080.04.2.1]|uniref:alpha/beta hydrolase n=1 Tax=Mesorhizobium sp. M3A.F.Ca.ET.080.04.2.1 TaxID=2493676 RepID=UPI000F74F972|nr:alpha/beta hydrolase [Mesorhizobium sp. M3A.F.Ca.ET.080.04.2.1]AZO08563.1 alpha/beta hydrolase [Mesorhizobium sp. M3A.F.Ca.ET.080.04.2.1]RWF24457.1 MAG: alpha/beta hydrolase [Mesorhizobium sp.]
MSKQYTVYFATNRNPIVGSAGKITGFGPYLSQAQGMDLRYGQIQVAVSGAPKQGKIVPGSLRVYDEKMLVGLGQQPKRGSDELFSALRPSLASAKTIVLFVHGFFNTFSDSMERAATILAFYGIDADILAFGWPSQGTLLGYQLDRGMARQSGPAFARVVRRLMAEVAEMTKAAPNASPPVIHLLCHSMGNYVLRFGVQALLAQPRDVDAGDPLPSAPATHLPTVFRQIILAAADEDSDAFDRQDKLRALPDLGRRVTVYYTHEDWVLTVLSGTFQFNGPRLGATGPDNMATISDKVVAVDVSNVVPAELNATSHQYYRIYGPVRDDAVAVLSGQASDKIPGRVATAVPRRYVIVPKRTAAPSRKRSTPALVDA